MQIPRPSLPIHNQIARWRWIAPLIIFGLAALHEFILWPMYPTTTASSIMGTIALYGFSGSLVVWFALDWLINDLVHQEEIDAELRQAYQSLAENHRQLLAVHDIGREIASAADMQQILELAVRAPSHLASATGSAIVTFDDSGDRLKLDMAWGLSDNYLRHLKERVETGIPAERCRHCEPLATHVSSDCPLFEGMQGIAKKEGIESLVCLPIVRKQKREGIISAYFPSPNGPPQEQVQLLNIISTGIASALDSVKLRSSQMAAIYAVENLTQSPQGLDDLLAQVLDASLAGWSVQGGAILLYDQAECGWHRWVQRGLGNSPNQPHLGIALTLAEETRKTKQPAIIPDLTQQQFAGLSNANGYRSAAAAPLIAGGQHLGALVMVDAEQNLFQSHHAPFLSAIAHQAALAVSNAQLHSQVQQMAVLEERYRLSREMHDGLAQTLGALGWQLDHLKMMLDKKDLEAAAQGLTDARCMTREAYMDVREAIDGLRLSVDHPDGLAPALEKYLTDYQTRTGIAAEFTVTGQKLPLPTEAEHQLLRIVQESLTNIRKHAAASRVWVNMHSTLEYLEVTVADDGQGFDAHLPRGRHQLGLTGMRERAESLEGSLTLATSPGQGTRITVSIPSAGEPV